MSTVYWLLRRAWYRHLWRARRVNVGQFFAALEGAPSWLERDTTPLWQRRKRGKPKADGGGGVDG